MGLLIKGKWHDDWYDTESNEGEFIRQDAQFRNRIGEDGFEPEADRYHLFVSLACPWAHRTLIYRRLKMLEPVIGITVVDPKMLDKGWEFSEVSTDNPVADVNYLYEIYLKSNPGYSGRVTVPVLWDKKKETIVNNESSDIIRLLNSSFSEFSDPEPDFYPQNLRGQIDLINARIYESVNNGVYRAGFATTQSAYENACYKLFEELNDLEFTLDRQRYVTGEVLTEADWRLFTTLIRFDSVYYAHFKTNLKRIEEFPNLSNYLRDLYQYPGVSETVNFEHIKSHYYYSHQMINPTRVVPIGPVINYFSPHNRNRFAR